jgi:hypothetical protein
MHRATMLHRESFTHLETNEIHLTPEVGVDARKCAHSPKRALRQSLEERTGGVGSSSRCSFERRERSLLA